MTTHAFNCDRFADGLADLLEHDVDEPTRVAMESHAAVCAQCGTLLADVRELRVAAAALPTLVPERDLWSGIAERIAAPVVPLERYGAAGRGRFAASRKRWALMGAAAAALVVVSVGTTYLTMRDRTGGQPLRQVASGTGPTTAPVPAVSVPPTPPQQGPSAASASSISPAGAAPLTASAGRSPVRLASDAGHKLTAEETYGREIAMLRAVVAKRRSSLDPATIAVIQKNLAVIDSAIAQCRTALAKDPASAFLLESLNSALETKVELLRTAAMLPAHT